jgi:hypothetical protein
LTQHSKTVTAEEIQEVARTGKPLQLPNRKLLTVDEIVALTSAKDWNGTLYELKGAAAYEIADTVNKIHGLEHQPAQVAHADKKVLATT